MLEKVNGCKIEQKKSEQNLLKKEKAVRTMTWYVLDFERTVNHLETEKILLMRTIKELYCCSSKITISSSRIKGTLLKHIPPIYFAHAIKVGKEILIYCSREVSDSRSFMSELRRN